MELNNGETVAIHLTTKVEQEGQVATFNFDLTGQLVKIGATLYLRYTEITDEGTEEPVTIKLSPDGQVQIMRGRQLRTRLQFAYQEKLTTTYNTPYGNLAVTTFTHDLHLSLHDQPVSGSLLLEYDLFSGTQQMGHYFLMLEFSAE